MIRGSIRLTFCLYGVKVFRVLPRDKPSIEYCVVLDESQSCKIWLRRDAVLLRGFPSDGKSKIDNKIMSFKLLEKLFLGLEEKMSKKVKKRNLKNNQ